MEKFIKIAKLGTAVKEFFVSNGTTVDTALALAEFDATGQDIRVNGVPADLDQTLEDGDIVTLIPAIKGG